jgi:hypothetical protein
MIGLMPRTRPSLLGGAALCLWLLSACGPGTTQPSATASPLARADLQRLYQQAADAYNTAEVPIEQAEAASCPGGSGTPNLQPCEAALSQDRQATIAFDNALRGLPFSPPVDADVAKLLADDVQLETVQEQAATAPSLTALQALTGQIFTILSQSTADAAKVRSDLGLPPATTAPTPTP